MAIHSGATMTEMSMPPMARLPGRGTRRYSTVNVSEPAIVEPCAVVTRCMIA